MKIIDAHFHASFDKEGLDFAREHGIDYSFKGLQNEFNKNNIVGAMLLSSMHDYSTPIELDHLLNLAKKDKRLFPVPGVNPGKTTKKGFEQFRKAFQKQEVHGIKIFLGYLPYYATDKKYFRFYKLAAEFDCPVIFHAGDTFGSKYMVKYSHPLQLDEVAVKFPNTKFVVAHLGNPWIRDAAEVVYKNPNVYTDLSAFIIGSMDKVDLRRTITDIQYGLDYVSDPSKFLFGTDWPLSHIKTYIKLMKKAIPRRDRNSFFYKNAKKLFKLKV